MLKEDKSGQGLSISTIILLVLGIFILIALIMGFTLGWNNLKDIISPSNNVKNIADSCLTACASDDVYGFCSMERILKATDLPDGGKEFKTTCKFLTDDVNKDKYGKYGIQTCPNICPVETSAVQ